MRNSTFESGKVLAAGVIYGGSTYGPERVLAPTTATVGWDLSKHAQVGIGNSGFWAHVDAIEYSNGRPGDSYQGPDFTEATQYSAGLPIVWNKTITVTGIQTAITDYVVDAQFYNCVPKTGNGVQYARTGVDNETYLVDAKHTGIYITKLPSAPNSIRFTITVIATLARRLVIDDTSITTLINTVDAKDGSLFVGKDFSTSQANTTNGKLSSPLIDVVHPSVQFKVTAIGRSLYTFGSSDTGGAQVQSYS